ncbi:MAG: hypothetical protein L3K11_04920 [Thermoplasmata archaeon]|nr:hypothetical protein [Thermoplasmata archaeon]
MSIYDLPAAAGPRTVSLATTPVAADAPTEPDSPSPPPRTLIEWLEEHRERVGWLLAIAITVGIASWVYWIQLEFVVPPGGDPGNWVSISYAYIGGQYPGQVNPYGYPPLLFPLLGGLVLLTGGPLAAGHLMVPLLIGMMGITLYALCRTMFRSVIVSLSLVGILLLNPSFMALYFWGAEPNLLAFVFLNLSLVGVVWTARSRSIGPLVFWVFAAATVLSHSLVGLSLGATVFLLLVLSLFSPWRAPARPDPASRSGETDDPGRLLGSLLFSNYGLLGVICFASSVGGWYVATAALGIPHPGYFTPGSAGAIQASYGNLFRNVFPGLRMSASGVYYTLVLAVMGLVAGYALALRFRPRWISTSVMVVLCSWMGVAMLAVLGWIFHISTDYHRFGFLLIVPTGLGLAYLADRLWLSRAGRAAPSEAAPVAPATLEERVIRYRIRPGLRGRALGTSLAVVVFAALLIATVTGPAFQKFERQFAGPGHDQAFLDALDAIDHSGKSGSILTVKGDLKWTWAVTHRSAYAPRPGDAFLFYPAQIRDSALAYYALTTHYAITNGYVSASLRSVNPAFASGMPDYQVYQNGGLAPTIRIDPTMTTVGLRNSTTGLAYSEGLQLPPTFTPPAVPAGPAELIYVEPGFTLTELLTIPPGSPTMFANLSVKPTGTNPLLYVSEVLAAPPLLDAGVQQSIVPGGFTWQTKTLRYTGLLTNGFVSPTRALQGLSSYYPPEGGPAAILNFTPSSPLSSNIVGSLELTTPAAASTIPQLPSQIVTPAVWSDLGVRFIIFPNQPTFALYAGSQLIDETEYLTGEFGCAVFFENTEWVVLTVPTS